MLSAMKQEFSRIRLFAFVDGIDEVTDRFEAGGDWLAPRNLLYHTGVISGDGHSDYGNERGTDHGFRVRNRCNIDL